MTDIIPTPQNNKANKKDKQKKNMPVAQTPRGFRDMRGGALRFRKHAINILCDVYEHYGFEPLDTPIMEYADSLGKFLPDVDRPEGGVFGLRDDDEQWLALRYDLTAPLARFVAANEQSLPRPFKRYQTGSVFRNEKPGPGRFREFTQCDADIVGTSSMASDASLCVMMSDALMALGIDASDYMINVNNRKLITAVLEVAGLGGDDETTTQKRLITMRAIDKLDRLGADGVRLLLGTGRKDASGDFTAGANLTDMQIDMILSFTSCGGDNDRQTLNNLNHLLGHNETGRAGINELEMMAEYIAITAKNPQNIRFDPAVIRGLGYYTGPVFEASLTFGVPNEKGQIVQFGSVAGGGRYDNLIERFTNRPMPAVGMSIGLDRLLTAVENRGRLPVHKLSAPVIVTVMDYDHVKDYLKIECILREAGIKCELYLGEAGFKAQMKYADKRGCPIAIIQGSQERESGTVILKDLDLGKRLYSDDTGIDGGERQKWQDYAQSNAQIETPYHDIVPAVQKMLADIAQRT